MPSAPHRVGVCVRVDGCLCVYVCCVLCSLALCPGSLFHIFSGGALKHVPLSLQVLLLLVLCSFACAKLLGLDLTNAKFEFSFTDLQQFHSKT